MQSFRTLLEKFTPDTESLKPQQWGRYHSVIRAATPVRPTHQGVLMSTDETKAELIEQAVAGNATALQELFLLNFDPLASFLRTRIPADLQATVSSEDVLQEVFAEATRRIHSFEGREGGALFRWLSKIAEHRVVDLIRSRRAAKRGGGRAQIGNEPGATASVDDLIGLLAVHERSPSRSVAGREAQAAIAQAIDRIRPDYGEAVRLRYFEGLPVADVAQQMGRTEASVHMLLHRGLAALRAELGHSSDFFSRKQ